MSVPARAAPGLVDQVIQKRVRSLHFFTAGFSETGDAEMANVEADMVGRLRAAGVPVEVQNYIDNTGVQVADVVVGFRMIEGKSIDEVRAIADTTRFDYYCWDLYARVTEWYDGDKARLEVRGQTLHDIERIFRVLTARQLFSKAQLDPPPGHSTLNHQQTLAIPLNDDL